MALPKTEGELKRFIENIVRTPASSLPRSLTLSEITAVDKLIVSDLLELSPQAIAYLKIKLGL